VSKKSVKNGAVGIIISLVHDSHVFARERKMAKSKPTGRRHKFIREEKPEKIFREMTQNHIDVLENIEFAIVNAWRENRQIDDKAVAAALKAVIKSEEPKNILSCLLVKALEGARLIRSDVSEEIWAKGLKVVLESVYTHSPADVIEQGDTYYLEFADMFIP
jgi:tRNA isopentenyl-2-thiomethyl-A-37 hydroxylase MiaE